jgi:hypothetical protein
MDEHKHSAYDAVSGNFGLHILENKRNSCGIALKKLGFIKRVVGRYRDEKAKERCYFDLVWPLFDYVVTIWVT